MTLTRALDLSSRF